MKDTPLSTSEKEFVLQSIKQNQRLDGRKIDEFRSIKINFGSDWGSAHVSIGETRVLAQVSCELGQPKATRPNEGLIFINVELGPMAAAHFEAGRNSDLTVLINRTLERTFKDSRCVDLESLCVTAEEKVWILRVDLNVLNHEGNITDCTSIAALCALAHFKHPDVSIYGEEVKIHTAAEKDPIPTVLHHYPVCVSFSTFHEGEIAVADPTAIEERAGEANMVFGLNSYRELCCLNLGGTTLTSSNLLLQCSHRAANRAKLIVKQVKAALAEDAELRVAGKAVGFTECLRLNKITSLAEDRLALKLRHFNFKDIQENNLKNTGNIDSSENGENKIMLIDENTAILNSNQKNIKWVPESDDSSVISGDIGNYDDDEEEDEGNLDQEIEDATEHFSKRLNQPISKMVAHSRGSRNIEISSDSEEEETMVLD